MTGAGWDAKWENEVGMNEGRKVRAAYQHTAQHCGQTQDAKQNTDNPYLPLCFPAAVVMS